MFPDQVIDYYSQKNDPRIVFVVGPDVSGKSSISRELSRQTGILYFKNKNEANCFRTSFIDELHYKGSYLFEILRDMKLSMIKDRDYPCEAAYSWAYRRETDMDFILDLDKKYRSLDLHIVFCYKTKYENFKDHLITEDKIPAIIEGYRRFKEMSINPWLELDTTDQDLESQISKIRAFIKR